MKLETLRQGSDPVRMRRTRLTSGVQTAFRSRVGPGFRKPIRSNISPHETCGEDQDLVTRIVNGDLRAFERLVERHGARMLAVARRMTGQEDDAEDALQDAFLSAFRSLRTFGAHCRLGTWLHRIVVNACLMKLRARRRRHERPFEDLSAPLESRSLRHFDDEEPTTTLEREELRRLIREKIDLLPTSHREIVVLRDLRELSTTEVAMALGVRAGAVKTRLHRARSALRRLFEEDPSISRRSTGVRAR